MAYFSDYIDLLIKVGDKRASTDPSFYYDWRDGHIITLGPVGLFTGTRDRQHHAVVRIKCGIAEKLTEVSTFNDLKTSIEFLALKRYITSENGGKLPWDFGYVDPTDFNSYRTRDWFIDFKDLLNKKVITLSQYDAIYDKSRQSDIVTLSDDLITCLKSEETDSRVVKDAIEVAASIGTIDAGGTYTVGTSQTYSTWASAIADLPADIGTMTTPGNIILQGNTDEELSEASSLSITSDTDSYSITLNTASGVRHNGGEYGNGHRINLATYSSIRVNEASGGTCNNVVITGLAVDASGTSNIGLYGSNGGDSGHIIFEKNVIKGNSASSCGITLFYNCHNMIVRNNSVYGFTMSLGSSSDGHGIYFRTEYSGAYEYEAYNNTCCKNSAGIGIDNSSGGVTTIKNNLCYGNTDYDFYDRSGPGWDTTSKNVSGDSTSPDGATYQSWTSIANMTDYANNDFRLSATDSTLDDGDDLSAIGSPEQFSDDIEDQSRSIWYIGASEYISGGTTYQGTCTDGFSMSETISRSAIFSVIATESINLNASNSNFASLMSSILESLELNDICVNIAAFNSQVFENVEINDSSTRNAIKYSISEDSINLSDVNSVIGSFIAAVTENIEFNDAGSSIAKLLSVVSDSINFSDSSLGVLLSSLIQAVAEDGFNINDVNSVRADFTSEVSEMLNVSDATVNILNAVASVSENIEFSDLSSFGAVLSALSEENISLSSATTVLLTAVALSADSITFDDAGTANATFSVSVSDNVQFSDTISAIAKFQAAVTEGMSFQDVALEVSTLPNGDVTMAFTVKAPRVAISGKQARITFTIKAPGITIE